MQPTIYTTKSAKTKNAPLVTIEPWEKVLVEVRDNEIIDTATDKPYFDGFAATICEVSKFGNLSIYPGRTAYGKTIESCKRSVNRMLRKGYGFELDKVVADGQRIEDMHASFTDTSVYESFRAWCKCLFGIKDGMTDDAKEAFAIYAYTDYIMGTIDTLDDAVNELAYNAYFAINGKRMFDTVEESEQMERLLALAEKRVRKFWTNY